MEVSVLELICGCDCVSEWEQATFFPHSYTLCPVRLWSASVAWPWPPCLPKACLPTVSPWLCGPNSKELWAQLWLGWPWHPETWEMADMSSFAGLMTMGRCLGIRFQLLVGSRPGRDSLLWIEDTLTWVQRALGPWTFVPGPQRARV